MLLLPSNSISLPLLVVINLAEIYQCDLLKSKYNLAFENIFAKLLKNFLASYSLIEKPPKGILLLRTFSLKTKNSI